MKDPLIELLSTRFNISETEARGVVDKAWRLMREEYFKDIVDVKDVKMGVRAEIWASTPEVNVTSTEEIRKAMEKVKNERTRTNKRIRS